MNKFGVLLLILVLVPMVSGQIFDMDRITGDEASLALVGLAVLFIVIIFSVLSKISIFENNKGVNFIVSIAISLIAVKYMSDFQLFYGIIAPAGIMGFIFIIALPFLLFLIFIHMVRFSNIGRKASWAVFAIFYLYMFYKRYSVLSGYEMVLYYAIFGLIAFSFVFDKYLQRYLFFRFKLKR